MPLEDSTLSRHSQIAVRLSALPTSPTLLPTNIIYLLLILILHTTLTLLPRNIFLLLILISVEAQ
jgi:hypothetical protein